MNAQLQRNASHRICALENRPSPPLTARRRDRPLTPLALRAGGIQERLPTRRGCARSTSVEQLPKRRICVLCVHMQGGLR